ncbi:cell division protein ZapA [Luteimonas sp. FCS-9]|uniref:cell division protein ZapA n=1 Tax=Luteimonas sp. FCS-9 TaxID=1547516 RepID=UPI00063EA05D|nr:cell division protein ZapA [Luteimonas sp. FCS-9]KLJ02315.1 cell division ZapA family protein [Luteimonas sp. FCS-9]
MSGASEAVNVRVLDREYTVGVAPGERDGLTAAARLLDAQMREIRGANRMAAVDRIAVLAALNFAHELLQLREQGRGDGGAAVADAVAALHRRLDAFEAEP